MHSLSHPQAPPAALDAVALSVGRSSGAPAAALSPSRRKLLEAGRALEALAHAVEFLEDSTPFPAEPTPRDVAVDHAIAILKQLNRDLYHELQQASAARLQEHRSAFRFFRRPAVLWSNRLTLHGTAGASLAPCPWRSF